MPPTPRLAAGAAATSSTSSDAFSVSSVSSTSSIRKELRRDRLNIVNRLRSITHDAEFIRNVVSRFPSSFVTLPNERCGSWYVDPAMSHSKSVYFKSTDGHFGQWDFNLRRLNAHIIPEICSGGGCIIVDSTRRGKSMPDSLAKTIPICASEAVPEGLERRSGYSYVQGSADDHEMWSKGLTPSLFWAHREDLLACETEQECADLIESLKLAHRTLGPTKHLSTAVAPFDWIGDTGIAIGSVHAGAAALTSPSIFRAVLNCGAQYPSSSSSSPDVARLRQADPTAAALRPAYLYLAIPEGKKGQVALYESLDAGMAFMREELGTDGGGGAGKVLVHCMQGKDRSVCMVLAFLIAHMRDDGSLDLSQQIDHGTVTKSLVMDRLGFIQKHRTKAQPCRANLQRINTYFMGRMK
ncbi:tRNA A64-2'-O-ribosylphosphate transferase [Zopfochytrium polystomum]|nr:tRNA A64-2'-O-ribosylphosphate transferase [Zopfochytrium polystomum]